MIEIVSVFIPVVLWWVLVSTIAILNSKRFWGSWPLQYSLFAAFEWAIRMGFQFNFEYFILLVFSPFVALYDAYRIFDLPTSTGRELPSFGLISPILALATLLLFGLLIVVGGQIRKYAVIISAFAALAIYLPVSEVRSQDLMCKSASEFGVSKFMRMTFLQSILQSRKLLVNKRPHAGFSKDGDLYGWSYNSLSFEKLDKSNFRHTVSEVKCVSRSGPLKVVAAYRAARG